VQELVSTNGILGEMKLKLENSDELGNFSPKLHVGVTVPVNLILKVGRLSV